MTYCLDSHEIEQFVAKYLESKEILDEELEAHYNKALCWEEKYVCLTYSLARAIQSSNDEISLKQIDGMYSIVNDMNLTLEECDTKFISYMLSDQYPIECDLESALLSIAKKQSEYCY